MPADYVVALDANALDAAGPIREAEVARFLRLVEGGRLCVRVTASVRAETERPGTPDAVRRLFADQAAPSFHIPTHEQKMARIRVRAALRGDGETARHEADAMHLCEAAEAGATHFVTHDRRILRRRSDLRRMLPEGFSILPLERLLAIVESGAKRDGTMTKGVSPRGDAR